MEKKIEDYLHLYWGAQVFYRGKGMEIIDTYYWIMPKETDKSVANIFTGSMIIPINKIKLILRHLETITPLEAIQICHLVVCPNNNYLDRNFSLSLNDYGNPEIKIDNDWYDETVVIGKKTGAIWTKGKGENSNYDQTYKVPAECYRLLLSWGYDLFELIPELAIDVATIEK